MEKGMKIKGVSDYYAEIEEAVIQERRFHMANVTVTKSTNPKRIGEELVVLLNEFELVESPDTI